MGMPHREKDINRTKEEHMISCLMPDVEKWGRIESGIIEVKAIWWSD